MRPLIACLSLVLCLTAAETRAAAECEPPVASNDQWPVATPESVGLDPDKLCRLVPKFSEWKEANVHAVVVARHGKLVFERYFTGYDRMGRYGAKVVAFDAQTTHDLRSATKSVTALLLGVAIDRGYIDGIDRSVLSYFPAYSDLRSPEMDQITIRHLLMMASGLAWTEAPPWANENAVNNSTEPYRYVLSQPMVAAAGRVWNYSSGSTALIGGVLYQATGKHFDELVEPLLLRPLGITDVGWARLPNGDLKNWCCFWLRPRDMAKIGQLVLDRGLWKGARVVPEAWIYEATAPQIGASSSFRYGYQFWLGEVWVSKPKIGQLVSYIAAMGQGGQRIYIVPSLDVVTVVTAGNYYENLQLSFDVPLQILRDYVLAATD